MTTTSTVSPRFDTIETHPDESTTAYAFFEPAASVMRDLSDELFGRRWQQIVVGPCIEGAVFEVCFEKAPDVRYSDGYLTVDLGRWHFHLCVGPTQSSASDELRRNRPVAKVAFFEKRSRTAPSTSFGLRLWNGYGEQMATVFLPNPRVSDDMKMLPAPDWSRLRAYYELRQQFLGEALPADFEAAASAPRS